jgi:hypothetical protein
MTTPTTNADHNANADTSPEPILTPQDDSGAAQPASKIPAFRFPFSPATFAPNKSDDQPWHQLSNKSSHDKTPGRAPNGTRRSMGKR